MVDTPCILRETVGNLVIVSFYWRTILGTHNMADIPRILRGTFRQTVIMEEVLGNSKGESEQVYWIELGLRQHKVQKNHLN